MDETAAFTSACRGQIQRLEALLDGTASWETDRPDTDVARFVATQVMHVRQLVQAALLCLDKRLGLPAQALGRMALEASVRANWVAQRGVAGLRAVDREYQIKMTALYKDALTRDAKAEKPAILDKPTIDAPLLQEWKSFTDLCRAYSDVPEDGDSVFHWPYRILSDYVHSGLVVANAWDSPDPDDLSVLAAPRDEMASHLPQSLAYSLYFVMRTLDDITKQRPWSAALDEISSVLLAAERLPPLLHPRVANDRRKARSRNAAQPAVKPKPKPAAAKPRLTP